MGRESSGDRPSRYVLSGDLGADEGCGRVCWEGGHPDESENGTTEANRSDSYSY